MKRYFTLGAVAVAAVVLASSHSVAASRLLNTYESANVQTNFSLNFPELGINSTSNVFYTRYKLDIDEEAGTARFTDYIQQIDPLMMPLGISTGRLDIRIVESSGTYDKATQTFETDDVYEITFANDLSGFGFESPVLLPAKSHGKLDAPLASAREVTMDWAGDGELQNAEEPEKPFKYTYTCSSRTTVAASDAEVPALPQRSFCADGIFSFFSFATLGLMFAGLKVSTRRMRR